MQRSTSTDTSVRLYGWLISGGSIAAISLMGLHPKMSSGSPLETVQALVRNAIFNASIHGSLMAVYVLLAVAFLGLCHYLGRHRVTVQLGYAAYVLSLIAGISAAVSAGFVMTTIAGGYPNPTPDQVDRMLNGMRVAGAYNFTWGRIWMIAVSAAVLLWSVELVRREKALERSIGAYGIALGAVTITGMIAGIIGLSVYAVLAMVAAQTLWSVLVGVLLIRHGAN